MTVVVKEGIRGTLLTEEQIAGLADSLKPEIEDARAKITARGEKPGVVLIEDLEDLENGFVGVAVGPEKPK